MKISQSIFLFIFIICSASGREYQDVSRHLRFTIPEGYEPLESKQPKVLAAWIKRGEKLGDIWVLSLSQMASTIPKGEMPISEIPAGVSFSMIGWHGERINCIRFTEKTPETAYVNLQVIFPTSPNALRLTFGALATSEARLKEVVAVVVGSVEVPIEYRESTRFQAYMQIAEGTATILVAAALIAWMRKASLNR